MQFFKKKIVPNIVIFKPSFINVNSEFFNENILTLFLQRKPDNPIRSSLYHIIKTILFEEDICVILKFLRFGATISHSKFDLLSSLLG